MSAFTDRRGVKTAVKIILWLVLSFNAAGCTTILDATHNEPLQTDPSKRSFGRYLDDRQLTTVAAVNIRKASPELAHARIKVYTYNATVLLTGQVPSIEARHLAAETAQKIYGVRQVYNELSLGKNAKFSEITYDKWLHTTIGAKLFATENVDSSHIEVIVEKQVVYLMGIVNRDQAEQITDVIRNIKGVQKVVRALEYIDS